MKRGSGEANGEKSAQGDPVISQDRSKLSLIILKIMKVANYLFAFASKIRLAIIPETDFLFSTCI